MGYGFFGQLLWMFGWILLLIAFGKANHVRTLAPGMVGSLSHSGLTGACTAGHVVTDRPQKLMTLSAQMLQSVSSSMVLLRAA